MYLVIGVLPGWGWGLKMEYPQLWDRTPLRQSPRGARGQAQRGHQGKAQSLRKRIERDSRRGGRREQLGVPSSRRRPRPPRARKCYRPPRAERVKGESDEGAHAERSEGTLDAIEPGGRMRRLRGGPA